MKCPYRKKVKVYPDGLGRTTEVDYLIKRNGEWRTFSGECENCGIRFIV